MEKLIKFSVFIVFVGSLFSGCSFKNDELNELKPNLKNLTKRANSAIERRGILEKDVISFLNKKYPTFMENFKEYNLKVKYENGITIVLMCEENRAIFEDLSCDVKIDEDYSNKSLKCVYHIESPKCSE